MLPNTTVFLLGLFLGTGLLAIGTAIGFWLGKKTIPNSIVDRQQFLYFLKNLTTWTTEFSGDISAYQSKLSDLNDQFGQDGQQPGEVRQLLAQIMLANRQLQERLNNAETKLEEQTDQISNYLVEARTDGLTGLFNRRALDKTLDELYADWQKKSQHFSLGLIDIDHFKQINDTYGHQAGDTVLKHVARELQSELDGMLCIARFGGEEFAVLSTASLDDVSVQLENFRESIGKIRVCHEDQEITLTLSAGTSRIEAGDRLGDLVRRADEALYASKLGGRNRVHVNQSGVCRLITKIPPREEQAEKSAPLSAARLRQAETAQQRVQERLQRIVVEESQRIADR